MKQSGIFSNSHKPALPAFLQSHRRGEKYMEENNKKIILDLCGGTGAWSEPYRKAGYDVRNITLPKFDLLKWRSYSEITEPVSAGNVYGILAAPTCTHFSRARTTAKTPRDFINSMKLVRACLEIVEETQYVNSFYLQFWALENPAGHLARFLGKPPYKFQPYYFGDRYSKETYLWGFYNLPKESPIALNQQELFESRVNVRPLPKIPQGYEKDEAMKDVQIRRSITPPNFGLAFFEANP